MNILAFLVLLSGIAISVCGAYFSIVGLKMLFVGGGISIVIMGTALEVGKLITATFLKQKWKDIGWGMRLYMLIATLFLMAITSIGIYGYLSAGYTATNITVQGYEQQIETNNSKVAELEKEIDYIKKSEYNAEEISAVDVNRKKFIEQKLQLIEQKNKQIENVRKSSNANQDASADIAAAKQALELSKSSTDSDIARELEQIKLYNARLEILDKEVQKWMEEGSGGLFKKSGLDKARVVKEGQAKERGEIDSQIKAVQDRIDKLRGQYTTQVKEYNDRVAAIENRSKSQRGDIEANVKKLENEVQEITASIDAYNKESDAKIVALNGKKDSLVDAGKKKINENLTAIQALKNENTSTKEKIVHTDVGTFKFIANSLGIPLDKAVNYFIWMIMSVFDPLAISLILAYNALIKKKEPLPEPSPTPTPTTTPTPTPTPTITLTGTPEPTPTPSITPEATPTATPEIPLSPTPEPTLSMTPEPTSTPTPTLTPSVEIVDEPKKEDDYNSELRQRIEVVEPTPTPSTTPLLPPPAPSPILRDYEHFSRPQP